MQSGRAATTATAARCWQAPLPGRPPLRPHPLGARLVLLAAFAVASAGAAPVPGFLYVLAAIAVVPLLLIAAGPRLRLPAVVLLVAVAAPAARPVARGVRRWVGVDRGARRVAYRRPSSARDPTACSRG